MCAILDTNVVIAAMRSTTGASHAILLAVHGHQMTPVISVPLLMEYEEVAKRAGMLPHLTLVQVDIVLNQICSCADQRKIFFRWRPFLPDPDDDMLVELAISANTPYIVTSNLRDVSPARELGIQVLEPREFIKLIHKP